MCDTYVILLKYHSNPERQAISSPLCRRKLRLTRISNMSSQYLQHVSKRGKPENQARVHA